MLDQDFEERLEVLEKRVEVLEAKRTETRYVEEPTLIPGAEYDFVPSAPDKIIGQYTIRVGKIVKESSLLGLTDEEWKEFATEEQ